MCPVFPLEQREEIKTRLLEVGICLIKENGIKRMTIDEVTDRVGIGKGTFYHFYESKEEYVSEVISFSKENIRNAINKIILEKGEINREALFSLLITFSFSNPGSNIISFISMEDEEWLAKKLPPNFILDVPKEEKIIANLMKYMVNTRENLNFHVIANILKISALIVQNRKLLHQDVLEENLYLMYEQLCEYIFVN